MRGLGIWKLTVIVILAMSLTGKVFADDPPFFVDPDNREYLYLDGRIDARSAFAFERVIAQNPQVTAVVLNSPGGSVQNGLLIARRVAAMNLATVVPKEGICASACTYIFFAGHPRLAAGLLGVHQIYSESQSDESATQTYVADILETLRQFNVHPEVTNKMLRNKEVQYFSASEIARWNINTVEQENVRAATPNQPQFAQPDTSNIDGRLLPVPNHPDPSDRETADEDDRLLRLTESQIRDGVIDFIRKHDSRETWERVSSIIDKYASTVMYFGKVTSRDEVQKDKRAYFERWPVRRFAIDEKDISIKCNEEECQVSGLYSYYVGSPQRSKTTSGLADFYFNVSRTPPHFITVEGGKVLRRN